jgi:proline dehydrogenase
MSNVAPIKLVHLPFDDTQLAYAHKSNRALRKSHVLFSLMNYPWLVDIGARLAEWSFRHHLPVHWLVKHTIYEQFCGGETLEEVTQIIHQLGASHIKTILDYGVEDKSTEEDFDHTCQHLLETLAYGQTHRNLHIVSLKLSGLFRFSLMEKVSRLDKLDAAERFEWQMGLDRVDRICHSARDAGIGIHIDAEHSWIQGAIDQVAWLMSERYNRTKPVVINAVQLYRKDRLAFLEASHEHARDHGYLCAVKLVRGAYMEKERTRARDMGYPDPIHATIQDTHRAYNKALEYGIAHIEDMYVCNASHNEDSCRIQAELMAQYQLPPGHPMVATAQLYGMSDNISYVMARAGYRVEKYLPYGPVAEVIPYLIRRTRENTAAGKQMGRELSRLRKELKRRHKGC